MCKDKTNILKKKLGGKNVVILAVALTLVTVFFAYTLGETKASSGILTKVIYVPKSNAPGNDAILIFNNSGIFNYVVINEYKSGLMLELEYKLNQNVEVEYKYFYMQDKNVAIKYMVI